MKKHYTCNELLAHMYVPDQKQQMTDKETKTRRKNTKEDKRNHMLFSSGWFIQFSFWTTFSFFQFLRIKSEVTTLKRWSVEKMRKSNKNSVIKSSADFCIFMKSVWLVTLNCNTSFSVSTGVCMLWAVHVQRIHTRSGNFVTWKKKRKNHLKTHSTKNVNVNICYLYNQNINSAFDRLPYQIKTITHKTFSPHAWTFYDLKSVHKFKQKSE